LKSQLDAGGGQAWLSTDGSVTQKPDVAIVVFGEKPYAEFMGDQADVALHYDNQESLAMMQRLKAQGIPVVAVLLSGRPLYLNGHINAADALVAGWLPGSEGAGFADVLLARVDGTPQHDFQGRLSFSWPKRPDQSPLNIGDADYDPQFAYGFGLTYAAPVQTPQLAEAGDTTRYGERNVYFSKGQAWNGYKLWLGDNNAPRMDYVGTRTTLYGSAGLTAKPQSDGAVQLTWNGKSTAWAKMGSDRPSDIAREANGAMLLSLNIRVNVPPTGDVRLGVGSASVPIAAVLKSLAPNAYTSIDVPLSCFAGQDLAATPTILQIETSGSLDLSIADLRLIETKPGAVCPAE
jgi:beta-glucosidase